MKNMQKEARMDTKLKLGQIGELLDSGEFFHVNQENQEDIVGKVFQEGDFTQYCYMVMPRYGMNVD